MARINKVFPETSGQEVESTLAYMRESVGRMTGRDDGQSMIEPLELYGHVPALLQGIVAIEGATGQLNGLEKRIRALAELKAATLTNCEYCIDIGSFISRHWGLSDEEMLALPFYETSELFTDFEKLVLDYAVGMSRTPVDVSDELVASLRERLDDAQLVELTHIVALENMRGRFNLALGVGAAGFSEGMVCAVPSRS